MIILIVLFDTTLIVTFLWPLRRALFCVHDFQAKYITLIYVVYCASGGLLTMKAEQAGLSSCSRDDPHTST